MLAPKAKNNETVLQRVSRRMVMEVKSGCWVWQGATVTSHAGVKRPKIKYKGKTYLVYRLVYEHLVEPLRSWQVVRHMCNNPMCVNPKHLRSGSHKDNMRDKKKMDELPYEGYDEEAGF